MLNELGLALTSWLDRVARRHPPRWYFPIVRIFGGPEGEYEGCYMTRLFFGPMFRCGRLFLHIFHRGDVDRDPHDHPFDFWTMPLNQGYTELVFDPAAMCFKKVSVPRWRWSFRPSTHCHRVTGTDSGRWPLVTLVWRSGKKRDWGFWCHVASTAVGEDRNAKGETIACRQRWWQYHRHYFNGGNANIEGVDTECPGFPPSVQQFKEK